MVIWGWAFAKEAMSGERRNVLRGMELVKARGMEDSDDSRYVLHAFRAAPFVTVVEIEAFALQDECTYAILKG